MLVVRCKDCNTELRSHKTKIQSCGCPNMTTVVDDKLTAVDLGKVIMIDNGREVKKSGVLTPADMNFQEERRKRKVRKLDFEVR